MALEKKLTVRNVNGKSKRRTRRTTDYWFNRYKQGAKNLTPEKINLLESYRPAVRKGIRLALNNTNLEELSDFYKFLDCYEYELMIKFKADILDRNVSESHIRNKARCYARKRSGTWFEQIFKQKESYHVHNQGQTVQFSTEGCFIDAESPSTWSEFSVNPAVSYYLNPEDFAIKRELAQLISELPEKIGKSGRKVASVYKKIIEMQLSGINVVGRHKDELGLETAKQVRELKSQAFKLAAEIMANLVPELKPAQEYLRRNRVKKWTVIRSTLKKRKTLYHTKPDEDTEPITIRNWHVYDGGGKKSKNGE